MSSPLTVLIAPDITASFCAPLPAGDSADREPWRAPPARIASFADWQAFRGAGAGRHAPVRILAAHRLGLRVSGGMAVVAGAARECAAHADRAPWTLILTAAAWDRLQRLASVQGSPWPTARVEPLAAADTPTALALEQVLSAHDHAGEAETTVRLALSELLAHGELSTRELAEVLRILPGSLRVTLLALQRQGLTDRHDGLWRVADGATHAVTAWLKRIHLPT